VVPGTALLSRLNSIEPPKNEMDLAPHATRLTAVKALRFRALRKRLNGSLRLAGPKLSQSKEAEAKMSNSSPHHVHAPHGGIGSWRDFAVHIAVVTIGLLLAVGLEQIVETVHNYHVRTQLEERIRETIENNNKINKTTLQRISIARIYFINLQKYIASRRHGQKLQMPPAQSSYYNLPMLGAYDAAKANGTIALLDLNQIRLYNRIAVQYELADEAFTSYRVSLRALRDFAKRYDSSPGLNRGVFIVFPAIDPAEMSDAEVLEYRSHVAKMIEAIDQIVLRINRLEIQSNAMLNGAKDENDLIEAVNNVHGGDSLTEDTKRN
jgi:hypothetical protein